MSSLPPKVYSDVLIQGSGISAHVCALLLAQSGLKVALSPVPQRAASLAADVRADVRAYALNQHAVDALLQIKVWPALPESAVCAVQGMEIHADDEPALLLNPLHGQRDMAWIVDVPALEATLRTAIGYANGVTQLQAGQVCEASLTVVCEGRASAMREQLGVEFEINRYAHTAIAARLHTEKPHNQIARQWFGRPQQGDILALLPMADAHTVSLVWSVDHERASELQALEAQSFNERLSAAADHELGNITLQSERMGWTLQLAMAKNMVGHGWALLADAAHNVHPLAGQGLNLGIADAVELARVLRERERFRTPGELRLLRRYERARKADTLAMGTLTDGIYHGYRHTDSRVQALRRWGLRAVSASEGLKNFFVQNAMGRGT
jgi:2-polyprenyl-6-methoxyphenol hydroxylase-like FAD-dependent oxidoreductase